MPENLIKFMSEKFRYQLRQEARQWQAEGLIDVQVYKKLAQRYQFEELDETDQNRFVTVLLGLGSVLLGLAVVTLVAANWQGWSRSRQIITLISALIGTNTAGFYLWQSRQQSWQTFLGKGLLLLGALLLGANLALMSQMFHLSGAVYQLYLLWGVGVLVMASGLRLTFLGILAMILVAIGYGLGVPEDFQGREFSGFQLVIQQMPLLVGIAFIPLAYWCHSRWLFGLAVIFAVVSLEINLTQQLLEFVNVSTPFTAFSAVFACIVPPGLLWAYRGALWKQSDEFDPIARSLALVFLGILYYWFSFNFIWQGTLENVRTELGWWDFLTFLDTFLYGFVAVWAWIGLGRQANSPYWRLSLATTLIATSLLMTGVLVWWHLGIAPIGAVTVVAFNLLLFALSLGLLRYGTTQGKRGSFWGGIVLLALQILTRMIEYDTSLIAKAVVLFATGIAVMVGGIWFEKIKKD